MSAHRTRADLADGAEERLIKLTGKTLEDAVVDWGAVYRLEAPDAITFDAHLPVPHSVGLRVDVSVKGFVAGITRINAPSGQTLDGTNTKWQYTVGASGYATFETFNIAGTVEWRKTASDSDGAFAA